jgi:hypothetical protein
VGPCWVGAATEQPAAPRERDLYGSAPSFSRAPGRAEKTEVELSVEPGAMRVCETERTTHRSSSAATAVRTYPFVSRTRVPRQERTEWKNATTHHNVVCTSRLCYRCAGSAGRPSRGRPTLSGSGATTIEVMNRTEPEAKAMRSVHSHSMSATKKSQESLE